MGGRVGAYSISAFLVFSSVLVGLDFFSEKAAASTWTIETVDSVGDVGTHTSMVLDSLEHPHISYQDWTKADLKYTWYDGTQWHTEVVDSVGMTGYYTSMVLDRNDFPHIAYFDYTRGVLRYAAWDGTSWHLDTVDSNGTVGRYPDIAFNSSYVPWISYLDYTNSTLKLAWLNGKHWENEVVDPLQGTGAMSSLVFDKQDHPRISYIDASWTRPYVKYAAWDGSAWTYEGVDAYASSELKTNLVLNATGYPRVVFSGNGWLMFAKRTETMWVSEVVDSSSTNVGSYSSMILDDNDFARVSYYGVNALRYAVQTAVGWNIELVDWTGVTGLYCSLAVDRSDFAHISYFDATNLDLKYARMIPNNPPNTPATPSGPTNGAVGVSYTYTTSTTDPDGDQVKYTLDFGDTAQFETGYVDSGTPGSISYAWRAAGLYCVKAMATDIHRAESPWSACLWVKIVSVPGPPRGLSAAGGNGYVDLSWSPPASDGQSPILNYKVYRGLSSGGETFLADAGTGRTYHDSPLTNGVVYYYRVSAVNAIGEGAKSNETSGIPAMVPSPPLGLTAVAGNGMVDLSWGSPTDDGGFPVTGYVIYRGVTSDGESILRTVGNVLTDTDGGLTNGITYFYKVAARNSAGEGAKSNEANATPLTTPSEPLDLFAVGGNARVTLTWRPPASDGGSLITRYVLYRGNFSGGETHLTETGVVLSYQDSAVTNGQTYFYVVTAKNAIGEGPHSNESSATPSGVPGPPRQFAAVAGERRVTLTWLPPSDDGGYPITVYVILRGTAPGAESELITVGGVLAFDDTDLTGLRTGTIYYYQICTENQVGRGPMSLEVNATPFTLPSEPLNLVATANGTMVTLTWTAPAVDGGSPIASYIVYRGEVSGGEWFLAPTGIAFIFVDQNVSPGNTYYYKVSAVNAAGEGPKSAEANAAIESTPGGPPPVGANYKPVVAAFFAIVLAVAGIWSSKRRPWKGGKDGMAVAKAFMMTSAPFVIMEAMTGVVSLLTGRLSIPPAIGPGTAMDIAILLAGLAASIVRALEALESGSETGENPDQRTRP